MGSIEYGRDEDNPRSQQLGCKLLACLAINPGIRNYFEACGATKKVIYASKSSGKRFSGSLQSTYQYWISFESKQRPFIRDKVIDSILEVLSYFTKMYVLSTKD